MEDGGGLVDHVCWSLALPESKVRLLTVCLKAYGECHAIGEYCDLTPRSEEKSELCLLTSGLSDTSISIISRMTGRLFDIRA